MKKWILRTLYTILAVLVTAGLAYHIGLRRWCLHWGTTEVELHSALPGDDLFPAYTSEATHAVAISAPPEKIWPWLMQIGQDRSGFYSYTLLENAFGCEMPAVHRPVRDWKPRTPGETVWFCAPRRYHGQGKMISAIVEPDHAFAMVSTNDWHSLQARRKSRGGCLELRTRAVAGWAHSFDRSPAWRNAAHAQCSTARKALLGTGAICHGTEDVADDPRIGREKLS
jgi:hypothetical protein